MEELNNNLQETIIEETMEAMEPTEVLGTVVSDDSTSSKGLVIGAAIAAGVAGAVILKKLWDKRKAKATVSETVVEVTEVVKEVPVVEPEQTEKEEQ